MFLGGAVSTRFLLLAAAALSATAATSAPNEMVVTAEQSAALGIELSEARTVAEAPVAVLPAVVRLPGDGTQPVVVPFGGTVVGVLAQEGQSVSRGQPLLRLRSRDYLENAAELSAANAEVRALQAQFERDRALVAEGIAPARQSLESEAQLKAAEARRATHAAFLAATQAVPGEPGDCLLLAPSAGVLMGSGLMAGTAVAAGQAAFFVHDGNRAWVDAQLGERLVGRVEPGFRAEAGTPPVTGRVIAVGQTVAAATRGVLLRAELPAAPGLRPGQVTELRVFAPVEAGTVLVPAAAVTRLDGKDTVFLATERGFVPVAVDAGLRTTGGVAVRGPGLAGGRVASAGVSALKALAQGE
jgi:cobalt-zinc-cadmium efflux system membrane fusion protein